MATRDMRREFAQHELLEADADPDPIQQFAAWFEDAKEHVQGEWFEANAMTLCTVSADGQPAGRIVLLKEFDERGFVFFTNYASDKGDELAANPVASLVSYWGELERQVRITGCVSKIEEAESEDYFHSRPRGSQLGALISDQSALVERRESMYEKLAELEQEYADESKPIPRPPTWGGYRVAPRRIEFWQGRPNRLHDRLLYIRQDDGAWKIQRLAP